MTRTMRKRKTRSKAIDPSLFRVSARPLAPAGYERVVDMFAGWGGASVGIEAEDGWAVDQAINHNKMAVTAHKLNHPRTHHLCEDVFHVEPTDWFEFGELGLLWASPDCTHFSAARGSKPKSKKIRSLANRVLHWARRVKPRVIMMENVKEFKTWCRLHKVTGQPDFRRKGEYFHKFIRRLQQFGYRVEYRILNSADYGAPTARHRLFIVARCDDQPIMWPKKTHGVGRPHPHRTAAECIDWSIPCPSIFDTAQQIKEKYGVRAHRPLAASTQRRIARGMEKYVINAADPFIVRTGHYSNITGKGDSFRGQSVDEPLGTVCSINDKAVVIPTITAIDNKSSNGSWSSDEPLRTITSENRFAVTSFVAKNYSGVVGQSVDNPLGTITSVDHHSLVTALLAKFRGDSPGKDLREPLPTITSGSGSARPAGHPHAMGIVTANMVSLKHGETPAYPCDVPLRTICAQGTHQAVVESFLLKYYGQANAAAVSEPLDTVTSKARFGLVTVNVKGEEFVISDIGMRMLQPRELLRAQFGEFADDYVLIGSNSNQVAGIGNSVCPHVAKAMVACNFSRQLL